MLAQLELIEAGGLGKKLDGECLQLPELGSNTLAMYHAV